MKVFTAFILTLAMLCSGWATTGSCCRFMVDQSQEDSEQDSATADSAHQCCTHHVEIIVKPEQPACCHGEDQKSSDAVSMNLLAGCCECPCCAVASVPVLPVSLVRTDPTQFEFSFLAEEPSLDKVSIEAFPGESRDCIPIETPPLRTLHCSLLM